MVVSISKIADIIGMDTEKLINKSIMHFIESEIINCEKNVGILYLENIKLYKKYGMDLKDLCKTLEELEEKEDYEDQEINGISVLEASSDSRKWIHIIEKLKEEEKKYLKLLELKKVIRG